MDFDFRRPMAVLALLGGLVSVTALGLLLVILKLSGAAGLSWGLVTVLSLVPLVGAGALAAVILNLE